MGGMGQDEGRDIIKNAMLRPNETPDEDREMKRKLRVCMSYNHES